MQKFVVVPEVEFTEAQIAECITSQYDTVNKLIADLVRRVMQFGSTLAQAEMELDRRGLLKNRKNGQGMQGWLADNCPTVNYKTAMRWKSLAVNAANSLSCSSDTALRVLNGETIDVPAQVSARAEKIFEATSLRKLTQQLFDFASEDRGAAGRPSGTTAATPTAHLSQIDAARRLWARPISLISSNRQAFYSAAKLLPIDDARETLAELKQLCAALKTRIDEN